MPEEHQRMDAKDLIHAGRLSEARQTLVEGLRRSPADEAMRTVLFQVLILFGEWDKALKQAEIIASRDVQAEVGVQVYRNLIAAERERSEAQEGLRRPAFLPRTPPYAERYFSALAALAAGDPAAAAAEFAAVEAMRPDISGTRNGAAFDGFSDTDTRLADFLEAFVHERYVWIPIESVRELVIHSPASLFDLIWVPGRITAWNGLALNCFFPVVYPGSSAHPDDRIKMGRMTDWEEAGEGFYRGRGQHIYQVGGEDVPILEMGEVLFHPSEPAGEGDPHA